MRWGGFVEAEGWFGVGGLKGWRLKGVVRLALGVPHSPYS